MTTFRNTLNLYCLRENVSPVELSFMLGCSKDAVEEMLMQESVIPAEYLPKLCELFDCNPSDLVL